MPSSARQCELNGCAFNGVGIGPQAAAMGLDNFPTDRQCHACALRFGGIERLENAIGLLRGDSDTRITHRNQQLTFRGFLRGDGQVTDIKSTLIPINSVLQKVSFIVYPP
jgi:hypothetical protein